MGKELELLQKMELTAENRQKLETISAEPISSSTSDTSISIPACSRMS